METNVFEEEEVQTLFTEFVLVRLYTDGGQNYRENQKMEIINVKFLLMVQEFRI